MIDYKAFKGRTVEVGERVQVYRKIVGGKVDGPVVWSIRGAEGLVRGHAKAVTLTDAYTYVNADAQARIAGGGVREVHAWVNGTLVDEPEDLDDTMLNRVSYQPHDSAQFRYRGTGDPLIGTIDLVHFNGYGMWA